MGNVCVTLLCHKNECYTISHKYVWRKGDTNNTMSISGICTVDGAGDSVFVVRKDHTMPLYKDISRSMFIRYITNLKHRTKKNLFMPGTDNKLKPFILQDFMTSYPHFFNPYCKYWFTYYTLFNLSKGLWEGVPRRSRFAKQ